MVVSSLLVVAARSFPRAARTRATHKHELMPHFGSCRAEGLRSATGHVDVGLPQVRLGNVEAVEERVAS